MIETDMQQASINSRDLYTIEIVIGGTSARGSKEKLLVASLSPTRFQLLRSPAIVQGLAAGDELEIVPNDTARYRVAASGSNEDVRILLPDTRWSSRVSSAIDGIEGRLDGVIHLKSGVLLVFTIPIDAGRSRIEQCLGEFAAEIPGMKVNYGKLVAGAEPNGLTFDGDPPVRLPQPHSAVDDGKCCDDAPLA